MLNTAVPYRRDDWAPMRVPVVMPLVEVTVDSNGYLTVLLDRDPYVADRMFYSVGRAGAKCARRGRGGRRGTR